MARLRVPSGVYVDGVAFGGRFADLDTLVRTARRTDLTGALAIGGVLERAERRAMRRGRITPTSRVIRDALERVTGIVDRKVRPPRRKRVPPPPRPPLPPLPPEEIPEEIPEDVDIEWEIGIEYLAAKGSGSNVDINIRFARDDGRGMTYREAREVFDAFRFALTRRQNVEMPVGYHFAAVNWRRPSVSGYWRGGRFAGSQHLEAMIAPLIAYADDDERWRLSTASESAEGI